MPDYEDYPVEVIARRTPDYSTETDANGQRGTVELPGRVEFGVISDGAFFAIAEIKGGHFFTRREIAAQQQRDTEAAQPSEPEQTDEQPAPPPPESQ